MKSGKNCKVLAGFDGFIDTIAKPVLKSETYGEPSVHFRTIREFGTWIAEHSGKSASLELDILDRRMGGNMPNFVRGIAALGAEVCAIGMLSGDQGKFDPVFSALPGRAFSFAPAGTATALEFDDGKIFLSPRYVLEGKPWALIEKALGETPGTENYKTFLCEADLIACLNWSELAFMDTLWRELFEKCAALLKPDKGKFVFFDLCDFSRKSGDEVRHILKLIEQFSAMRTTILSLNRNEALLLEEAGIQSGELAGVAEKLTETYAIDEIIIHSHDGALAKTAEGTFTAENTIIPHPKISTGAGDHFNAAWAFAACMEWPPAERLRFANYCARSYVSSGRSPGLAELPAEYQRSAHLNPQIQ
ncbi:hypothetical protein AGMMS50293_03800 [Spirochaetia bacterium]|nr:hypothetical protein AGMMS50293_03800 [Spirochaetia bacterium]